MYVMCKHQPDGDGGRIWAISAVIDYEGERHVICGHPYDIHMSKVRRYKFLKNITKAMEHLQTTVKQELYIFELDDVIAEASKHRTYTIRYDKTVEGKRLTGLNGGEYNAISDAIQYVAYYNEYHRDFGHENIRIEEGFSEDEITYRHYCYPSEVRFLDAEFIKTLIGLSDREIFDRVEEWRKTC